jgi:hypothetical protein
MKRLALSEIVDLIRDLSDAQLKFDGIQIIMRGGGEKGHGLLDSDDASYPRTVEQGEREMYRAAAKLLAAMTGVNVTTKEMGNLLYEEPKDMAELWASIARKYTLATARRQ